MRAEQGMSDAHDSSELDGLTQEIEAKVVQKHESQTTALEDRHLAATIDEAEDSTDRRVLSPFLPASARDIALVALQLGIGDKDNVLDLGCGDGRVLVSLALTRGTRGTGVDISEDCVQSARSMAEIEGVQDKTVFQTLDLLNPQAHETLTSLPLPPTLLFLYVYPTLLRRIAPLVRAVAEVYGARVVTLVYHLEEMEWVPSAIVGDGRIQVYGAEEHDCGMGLR